MCGIAQTAHDIALYVIVAQEPRSLAVAVRPGDVGAVPGGLAMLLAGLGALAVARRRRHFPVTFVLNEKPPDFWVSG